MIAEALQWLKDQRRDVTIDVDGKKFAVEPFKEIKPDPDPQPAAMKLSTLGGLVAWVKQKQPAEKDAVLRVASPDLVELVSTGCDQWGRRLIMATATKTPYTGFRFNTYLNHEDFCIGLQQHFVPADDASDFGYVARVSATITAEAVTVSENDGISQQVALKRSVKSGLKDFADLRRVVNLAPFRTFTEASQPASPFIFRAKDAGEGDIPLLALFECDGGRWQTQAMGSIADFLLKANVGLEVIC